MKVTGVAGAPEYEQTSFKPKQHDYCLLIPVINEGERIIHELQRAKDARVFELCDIIICDGGSTDHSMDEERLKGLGVNTLLVKLGSGKQGAQLRVGIHFAFERDYLGVLTVDGNDKDSIECVPLFIDALQQGYGFVQGSRFVEGGVAENTPLSRLVAVRTIHAPVTSWAAKHHFTDTTNAFRAYSMEYLKDPRVQPLRDVFGGYELLAYLAIRATQLGYRATEVPVARRYPEAGKTPTKISPLKGNIDLLRVLYAAATGKYDPPSA